MTAPVTRAPPHLVYPERFVQDPRDGAGLTGEASGLAEDPDRHAEGEGERLATGLPRHPAGLRVNATAKSTEVAITQATMFDVPALAADHAVEPVQEARHVVNLVARRPTTVRALELGENDADAHCRSSNTRSQRSEVSRPRSITHFLDDELGPEEVIGRGDLDVLGPAHHDRDRVADPLHDR